jgi:next-to-BRCA1 protein 1
MKIKLTLLVTLVVMLSSACGAAGTPDAEPTSDVAAIRTSAARTVVAEFTLTAAAFTPTPSEPTDTPEPEITTTGTAPAATATLPFAQVTDASGTVIALCDSLDFVADVNVPDDTNMSPGQDFVKTWRVKNTGSCPWGEGYELVYAGYADQMGGQPQALTQVVQPGQEVELSVQFQAPDEIGEYLSAWQLANPRGITMPEAIYVRIIVQ